MIPGDVKLDPDMPKLCDLKFPSGCRTLPEGFWSSVDVWIKKPHVVNKRLCGAKETEGGHVGREALKFLLDGSDSSAEVLSFISGRVSWTEEHKEPWSFSVRTIIPKVNCYGTTSHKEVILKGKERSCRQGPLNCILSHCFCPFQTTGNNRRLSSRLKRMLEDRCVSRGATCIRFCSSIGTVRNGESLSGCLGQL